MIKKVVLLALFFLVLFGLGASGVYAQEETLGSLEEILFQQELGAIWPANPLKYAIRSTVGAGVPASTIVLLLLLPVVAFVIAASRHVVGLRGFGIFLPAALSVVFVALGPVIGIFLFLLIVTLSTVTRLSLRKLRIQLEYLPRMALILWSVVVGVLVLLFLSPFVTSLMLGNISIFPVLILALLAEDFTKTQIGKSAKTAISLTSETLILALMSYILLTLKTIQEFALLNPEILLLSTAIGDLLLGRYVGLRLREFWRFRKLIRN
ncbi:hypothetical protein A2961_03355 [Candidatus Woesebacteria bacterium RIFCSPLOWO2_01_FULL_39_21]|uniref:7 transmembrane helices usually fused to an inactive transglutaminase domain-containing protein n=1 Tax=Candidatus Woesebacteria bacterium RIFCSPLOWO2_01_FULL_39_21 TaxID=1802519 RepID=A0A1F8BG65_9BACT|nr:MAG: hypothetical protein A2961_03355 [Candidatus Woesebacteria bacterium RIFCSPLOWO2_01_FULL_39_21]